MKKGLMRFVHSQLQLETVGSHISLDEIESELEMPFAYVTEPGATLRCRGQTLLVEKDRQQLAEWEIIHLESLVLIGTVHITTPAMKLLLKHGVETAFVSSYGKLLGQLTPPKPGNVHLRLAQYQLSQDEAARLRHAQAIVAAKLTAMRNVLNRYATNYPEAPLSDVRDALKASRERVSSAASLDQLRGIEGNASAAYWQAFPAINRSELEFAGRNRRPSRDPVNALLNLGYVFLTNELSALLDALGFDPFVGFYHDLRPNRASLALDLIEPFRHHVIDRMVLRLINLKRLTAGDFEHTEADGVRLQRAAFKIFIAEYERSLNSVSPETATGGEGTWRTLLRQRCLDLRLALTGPGWSQTADPGGVDRCFSAVELDEPEEP
jgi:CRISP-associated protein Cas1